MTYSLDTRCIHGDTHKNEDANRAISYPIYQTASFGHIKPGHNDSGFDYSRESNPTRSYLEETVSSLEGAVDTVAFSSGMAAITACFARLRSGDHIICTNDLYGGTVRLLRSLWEQNGISADFVDTRDLRALEAAFRPETKAVYIETPSNPMMHVSDIRACAGIAKAHGALLVVDNTFLSPYFQNPIKLGADVVIHSGTKFIGGHNDTVCGFLCSANEELAAQFRLISKTTGATLAPFDAWLVLRGLKTLPIRMERQAQSAQMIAEWLEKCRVVEKVYYVGLPGNPGKELNDSQARGAGSMISFTVNSAETALRILRNIKLITFAESLGGVETLMTYPALQTHPDVPEETREALGITDCLLRLSVGLENVEDLIADLKQAMEALDKPE